MKRNLFISTVIIVSFISLICFNSKKAQCQIKVSKEMEGFLQMIKGTADDVEKALKTYASNEDLLNQDMFMYDLEEPKVIKRTGNLYSVEFKAGMTVRLYDIFWKNKKITSIKDHGIIRNTEKFEHHEEKKSESPEMSDFIKIINNKPDGIKLAFKKYGVNHKIKYKFLEMHHLEKAKIEDKKKEFYLVEFTADTISEKYALFWKDEKIQLIIKDQSKNRNSNTKKRFNHAEILPSNKMADFLNIIGKNKNGITKAFKKYCDKKEIKNNCMEEYNLGKPKIIKKIKENYSVEFIEGSTTRLYDICWMNNKIIHIKDYGVIGGFKSSDTERNYGLSNEMQKFFEIAKDTTYGIINGLDIYINMNWRNEFYFFDILYKNMNFEKKYYKLYSIISKEETELNGKNIYESAHNFTWDKGKIINYSSRMIEENEKIHFSSELKLIPEMETFMTMACKSVDSLTKAIEIYGANKKIKEKIKYGMPDIFPKENNLIRIYDECYAYHTKIDFPGIPEDQDELKIIFLWDKGKIVDIEMIEEKNFVQKTEFELSIEMSDFLNMIKGTADDVVKAIVKYAATENLKDNEMGYFDLKDPKITKKEGDCYSIEFTAGITIRMYDICWKDGEIIKIVDKGMK